MKLLVEITRNAQLNTKKKNKASVTKNSINQIMDAKHGCTTRNSISFILTNERLIFNKSSEKAFLPAWGCFLLC